jgi:hypothetical protein
MSSSITLFDYIDGRLDGAINKAYDDGGLATVGELFEELFSILHGGLNAKALFNEIKEALSHQAHEERLQRVLEQSRRFESPEELKESAQQSRQATQVMKKFIIATLKSHSKRVYESMGLLGYCTLLNVLDPRNQRHLFTTVEEAVDVMKAELDEML